MANMHGDFVWYELMTPDPDSAARFYGAVVGWTQKPSSSPDMDYREWSMAGVPIGGALALTDDMRKGGAQPCWLGYVHVDDIDGQIEKLKAGGATIMMGPQDIPGVGRFAMITDPQGVALYVMTDTSGETSTAFAKDAPKVGHCAWNELSTTDPAGAWSFYGSQFGWTKDGELDMGPMGKYEFIKSDAMIGAIMPKMPEMPVPAWTFYFRVPDIDAAASQIKADGGTLFMEPMEIPGGEFSLSALDPQGAAFGLVGPRIAS